MDLPSQSPFSNIVEFYRTCFEQDNRETGVWRLLSKKIPHKHFFQQINWPLETGPLTLPIKSAFLENVEKVLVMHPREYRFVFGAVMVLGHYEQSSFGRRSARRMSAPLILFPATIRSAQQVEVDLAAAEWNPAILQHFDLRADDLIDPSAINPFSEQFGRYLTDELGQLGAKVVLDFDRTTLPRERRLAQAYPAPDSHPIIYPAAVVFVASRSQAVAGISHELSRISRRKKIPAGLEILLGSKSGDSQQFVETVGTEAMPVMLNDAQARALKMVSEYPLSVIMGAPGTGKTHLLSAFAQQQFASGRSILLVTQNQAALDVVENQLVQRFGMTSDAILNVGAKGGLRRLRSAIKNLMQRADTESMPDDFEVDLYRANKSIRQQRRLLTERLKKTVRDEAKLRNRRSPKWLIRFRQWRRNRQVMRDPLLIEDYKALLNAAADVEKSSARSADRLHRSRLGRLLYGYRKIIIAFREALDHHSSGVQASLFAEIDFGIVAKALPVWLVPLNQLHKVLPLSPAMFDLVAIDEATQCHMAAAIPAVYRARHCVVVGDQHQLRHLSFLSESVETEIAERLGIRHSISYRGQSLLDVAEQNIPSQRAMVRLDEHFRSQPDLISFSNQRFYENRLKVLAKRPTHKTSNTLQVIHCEGQRKNGVNAVEGDSLLQRLSRMIAEEAHIPDRAVTSFGVISFFREQADYLEKRITDTFSLEQIRRHRLRVSTPYGFQGDECDVILLSCAIGTGESAGVMRYLNRPDLFNVAVTRARLQQLVFCSVRLEDLSRDSLLADYLRHIEQLDRQMIVERSADAHLGRVALCQALQQRGFDVFVDYPLAGISLDILACRSEHFIGIDLVGFEGELGAALRVRRYELMERTGLLLFPVSQSEWRWRREEIVDLLEQQAPLSVEPQLLTRSIWREHHQIRAELLALDAETDLTQQEKLLDEFRVLTSVLNAKLSPQELTYQRYHSAALAGFNNALRNLSRISALHQATKTGHANERTDQRIAELREQNEELLQRLKDISVAFMAIETERSDGNETDATLSDLERLAEQVSQYDYRNLN